MSSKFECKYIATMGQWSKKKKIESKKKEQKEKGRKKDGKNIWLENKENLKSDEKAKRNTE